MNKLKNISFFMALVVPLGMQASWGKVGQLWTVNGMTQETYVWGTPLREGQQVNFYLKYPSADARYAIEDTKYKPWEYVVARQVKPGESRIEVRHESADHTAYIIPSGQGNEALFVEASRK